MTAKILTALHEVMSKVGYVQKSKRNEFHRYNYAGEGDLLAVLRPAMVEAGLLLIPSVTEAIGPDEFGNTTVRIEYTLAHRDGDVWPEKVCAMGCGNDKNSKGGIGDKGLFKAVTGANKYALFKLFQIETGDDPEKDEAEVPPPKPAPALPAEKREAPPPSTATFWSRSSYELTGRNIPDIAAFATAFCKACEQAPSTDAILKLDEDNKEHLATLRGADAPAYQKTRIAVSAAHSKFPKKAA